MFRLSRCLSSPFASGVRRVWGRSRPHPRLPEPSVGVRGFLSKHGVGCSPKWTTWGWVHGRTLHETGVRARKNTFSLVSEPSTVTVTPPPDSGGGTHTIPFVLVGVFRDARGPGSGGRRWSRSGRHGRVSRKNKGKEIGSHFPDKVSSPSLLSRPRWFLEVPVGFCLWFSPYRYTVTLGPMGQTQSGRIDVRPL